MTADAGQVNGSLDARITATDDRDILSFVERTVTMRTEVLAMADVPFLTSQTETTPAGTCGNHHCGCGESLSTTYRDRLLPVFQVCGNYLPVVEYINRIV